MQIPNGLFSQVLAGVVLNLGFINIGGQLSFPSILSADVDAFSSNMYGNPLTLTANEKDLFGSLICPGCLLGGLLVPLFAIKFGIKISLLLTNLMACFCWLGLALLPNFSGLAICRIFIGFANAGISVTGIAYTTEISENKHRGLCIGFLTVSVSIGIFLSDFINYWWRYYGVAFFFAGMLMVFVIAMLFLPESPRYLAVNKGKIDEAKKSLKIFRGNASEAEIEEEIESYLPKEKLAEENKSLWQILNRTKIWKRIGIVCVLFMLRCFGGYEVLTANASRMFKNMEGLDDKMSSLLVYFIMIIGTLIAALFLLDKIGRKNSMILSTSLASIGLISLGIMSLVSLKKPVGFDSEVELETYLGNKSETMNIIKLVFILFSFFALSLGVTIIPFVVISEYFPTKIRTICSGICFAFYTTAQFVALQSYSPLVSLLTVEGMFLASGIIVAIGVPFSIFFVIETKGTNVK